MRKNIVSRTGSEPESEQGWLDLEQLARVEVSSEEPTHQVEYALKPDAGPGWRAAEPGEQFLRLIFDHPVNIRKVSLKIEEREWSRTQEFVLRCSKDGREYRDVLRQQFNFNPPGTTTETEDFSVELSGITALELDIKPDISGSGARASLARLRLA